MDLDQPSSSASRKKYHVFISFRGEDTRKGFTSHLHTALVQKQIETYIDDQLVRGDEISKSLLDAIEDSQISVVIFSENYASSSWCLDELLHILHCKENNNQIVLPVFYNVNPSDVRKQGGSYAAAFAKLEQRYKDSIIQKWRTALITAANLSGYDASESRNESELIGNIVKDIMGKVNLTPSSDHLKGLVGIDKSMEDLKSLLFTSSSHVCKVGIWGMGGVGKTTLARAIYIQVYSQFEGQCFLDNVREKWKPNGPTDLQLKLIADLLKESTDQVKGNMQAARERLGRKKLLIVLDDVDDDQQYRDLVEDYWLNSESRVILTSRDQQVLRSVRVDDHNIYNLKPLYGEKAFELFCSHAFKENFATEGFEEMSREFVNYAAGNPLALRVLGSHLIGKSKKEYWKSMLNKLKVLPDQKIHNILKISYDGLDDIQKEIFLDIACLFKGWREADVEEILDYRGCFAVVIGALKDKCLINIGKANYLDMHDLLEEMGLEIVRHKQPEEQSRLWNSKDTCDVLRKNTGSPRIEAIILSFQQEDISLEPDVFQKMKNLRLFRITCYGKFQLPRGLYSFPNSIRYLYWDDYPLDSLGSHFTPCNLVHLHMPYSQLERLWNESKHNLENLKFINLSNSKKLKCLPNLSSANLSRLDLRDCTSLVELPPLSFETNEKDEESTDYWGFDYAGMFDGDDIVGEDRFLNEHNKLYLKGCSNLKTLSKMSRNIKYINLCSTAIEELHSSIGSLNNLRILDLKDCDCLKDLPVLPPNLKALNLSGTLIKQVDESSFEHLPCLEILDMNSCLRLETLPTCLYKLKSLRKLFLSGCLELNGFPEILEPMELLYELWLDKTGIKELPSSIKNLNGLTILDLSQCKDLESIPTSICKLKSLSNLSLFGCSRFNSFPEILEPMELLAKLWLAETGIKELPSSIENLNGLKILDLRQCKDLESIPISICKLKSLQKLSLFGCSRFNSFPEILEPMELLGKLSIAETRIKELPSSIENLNGLEFLNLNQCKNLESIPTSIYNIKCLKHLHLNGCPRLKRLPAISFESIESITVCLSYRDILQLCDSQSNLSFLEMIDPSDSIPICIIRKRNEDEKIKMSFMICKCGYSTNFPKRCKLFLEKHFGGDHWTEGSIRFTRYQCSILTEFSYCPHCYSFDEVCNILTTEFHHTVLHRATASVFKHGIQEADHPRINISYPRNKIPEWFIYHATGSSIDIKFSPLPHDSSFLGFALCIVVDCEENWFCNSVYWEISCEYHFKTKDGESHQNRWTLQRGDCTYPHVYESEYLNKVSMSSQLFIWHLHEDDYHDYHDATGASFKFYINKQSDDSFGLLHIIKECGIRILTLQDAEEFGISKPVLAQNINSNINEPHRKRLKSLS